MPSAYSEVDMGLIDDTFAEAFRMRYARVIVTAHDEHWALAAAREATGYGSSIIACDAEAGIERVGERNELRPALQRLRHAVRADQHAVVLRPGLLVGTEQVQAAAQRGVRVRLLLDDLNTGGLDPTIAALDAPARALLARIPGATVVDLDAGCCGMAGAFGYEARNMEVSVAMAELSLLPAVRAAAPVSLRPGLTSSRSHLVQVSLGPGLTSSKSRPRWFPSSPTTCCRRR